ncbi:helix-turn-helix domain-containing protein [Aquabacterium humicola]|uniref:helix-turn-helix domain-containing protein n=1 Tax=Aquabacterium humicola TaxID=3237377 RepID=UPI002542D2D3|nr:helix-turn-helix transcriptional regulator [Rubrivivax pictus]
MKQLISVPAQAGALLQAARKAARLSQTTLAQRLGLSQSRVSAMELDPGSISLEQLLALCAALQLELVMQTRPAPGADIAAAEPSPPEW